MPSSGYSTSESSGIDATTAKVLSGYIRLQPLQRQTVVNEIKRYDDGTAEQRDGIAKEAQKFIGIDLGGYGTPCPCCGR